MDGTVVVNVIPGRGGWQVVSPAAPRGMVFLALGDAIDAATAAAREAGERFRVVVHEPVAHEERAAS